MFKPFYLWYSVRSYASWMNKGLRLLEYGSCFLCRLASRKIALWRWIRAMSWLCYWQATFQILVQTPTELLQLHYFLKVAKLEHMTKAAQELRIAQPALSKTIARLEEDLGVPLFDRKGRNIRLNSFGKVYLKKVEMALEYCFCRLWHTPKLKMKQASS